MKPSNRDLGEEARLSLLQQIYNASTKPNRNTTSSRVDHAILPIQLGENLVSRQLSERMILQLFCARRNTAI